MSEFLSVLLFYQLLNLPIKKVCMTKNFEEPNFSDFKKLIKTLKSNPQKHNWPLKTCKPLHVIFLG